MAKIDAIEISKLLFDEAAAPGTPAATNVAIYAKADGLMYSKDDAGAETLMSGTAGGSGSVTVHHAYTRSAGNYTTTSGTLVAVDATADTFTKSVTVAEQSRLRVSVLATLSHSATVTATMAIAIDGTPAGGTSGSLGIAMATTELRNGSFTWMSAPLTAGTYSVALFWQRGASGTATLRGDAGVQSQFVVEEIAA